MIENTKIICDAFLYIFAYRVLPRNFVEPSSVVDDDDEKEVKDGDKRLMKGLTESISVFILFFECEFLMSEGLNLFIFFKQ